MGQAERPTCPDCGAYLMLALPPGGKGPRTFQCFRLRPPRSPENGSSNGLAKGRATPAKVKQYRFDSLSALPQLERIPAFHVWDSGGTMQIQESEDRPEPTAPPCFRCGAQPAYSTTILDTPTGRIFHMFICECGNRSWVSESPRG
jgi:hypothetical protein